MNAQFAVGADGEELMRRSRFAKAVETPEADEQSPVGEAMWLDIRLSETAEERSLASWRVESLQRAPLFLGASHALIGLSCLCLSPQMTWATAFPNALLLLGLVLLLDAGAALAMHWRQRMELEPSMVTRCLCLYFATSGLAWAMFGRWLAFHAANGVDPLAAEAMLGGLAVAAVAAIFSPPLAIVNALVATSIAAMFAGSTLVIVGVSLLSLMMVAYSIASARCQIANGRRRLRLEAQARKAQSFVDEFESSGRGWFWETNAEGTLSYVSLQLADDFQCRPEELLGRRFTDLLSVDKVHSAGSEESKTLGFHLSARFPFSDVVVRPASKEDIHWSLSGNPIFDERGRFLGFRGIGTDLTEQRRSEQEITRLARFDSLTGLPNRAMMRQTLENALRNSTDRRKGCAMFIIDLDRFKNVNDTLGHPIGDALLRQVAERLKLAMGNHGQIGRLGGDEFQAVLPGTVDVGLLESLARTMIEQVSRPYVIEGHKIRIGASLGIEIGDPGRSCADAIVRNADLALYAAKAAGRGQHCFFKSSMHSDAAERQMLENDLRQALERGELSVAYQPIVHSASEELSGFEALVRWDHPVRGSVPPESFIPLAEETGLIGAIGEFVLKTALTDAARWPEKLRIAVNLSPVQFNDPGLIDMIARHLRSTRVKAARLELEITEGVFLAEGDMTDEIFARLKALGVRLALDDFGTGYSSLAYLKKAPFDKIKIDQSFVRGASSSTNRNAAIIRAIVTLADTLGMDSCAEGVETHDDLELIRHLGVSMIQGFIFGRPSDAKTAFELANAAVVEPDGFQCTREPRQRLMRRAITAIDGTPIEVRLGNISAMGAQVECPVAVSPGQHLTIDIVGAGPVRAVVRWAQSGKFGVQFDQAFDLTRLAPKREKLNDVTMLTPWYVEEQKAAG
ncbi:MAG: EAL domain-containing protein [Sphingomicrobium sp.]